jgi:hypothetical protein
VPVSASDGPNVLRLEALPAVRDDELDSIAFGQRFESSRLDVREMDEDIVSIVAADEAVSLVVVEELDGTNGQSSLISGKARLVAGHWRGYQNRASLSTARGRHCARKDVVNPVRLTTRRTDPGPSPAKHPRISRKWIVTL